ncbi:apyrase-like isoform X2 [Neocloeon triangulifer]|uniref:apyrase-like isoform X2 n=1 Tax=Neocloeon triangulifer TaxID=2078957 RepID=UPI00286F26FA|nr:apyrase-like isoform X2 [Neocloeon triangulifer]
MEYYLGIHAKAFGNHEFDDKVAGIVPFVDGLKSPMVAANMDASLEPTLDGKFVPSVTIYRDKTKIGIIGCISKETPALSSPENLIFNDEIESVSAEVKKLKADGVKIIILLSHSGYDVDLIIAEQIPELDVIVGGHSHTFLYSGTPPTTDEPVDEYPKVVTHRNGGKTLIVQAMAFGKYLGILELKFDKAGEVESWSGNPILLDSSVPEDESTTELLSPYREEADVIGGQTLGTSAVLLDSSTCYSKECNLGNFLTDAIVHEYTELINDDAWTTVAIAIMNPGGIRAPMGESANVTFNDLITAQPFQNTIDTVELQGKDIVELMELAASPPLNKIRAKDFADGAGCFQVSGIRAKYDMSQAEGSRLVDIALKCSKCVTPEFLPVNSEEWYTVAMPSFLASGNSFPLITERGRNRTIGRLDTDVYVDYIKTKNPIMTGIEHRITVL